MSQELYPRANHEDTPTPESVDAARDALKKAQDHLEQLNEELIKEGLSPEVAKKAEDKEVASLLEHISHEPTADDDSRAEVAQLAFTEINQQGLQPDTAMAVVDAINNGGQTDSITEAFQKAEESGVDTTSALEDIVTIVDQTRATSDLSERPAETETTSEREAIIESDPEYVKRLVSLCDWDYESDRPVINQDKLQKKIKNQEFFAGIEAVETVKHIDKCKDEELREIYYTTRFDCTEDIKQCDARIAKLEATLSSATSVDQKSKIQKIIEKQNTGREWLQAKHGTVDKSTAEREISKRIFDRSMQNNQADMMNAQKVLEKVINDRRELNRYPWTMPEASRISPENMRDIKYLYEMLIEHKSTEWDVGLIRVPGKSDEEKRFLKERGIIDNKRYGDEFAKSELRKAGIFFVNKVGDGEQPVLDGVIFDDEGRLSPGEHSMLTQSQFKRVYEYQQARGMGIGDLDPDDVVMDMIMADRVRGTRAYNIYSCERINKYGDASSLFVDGNGEPLYGAFGGVVDVDKNRLRITAIQANLINGNKKYPGTSEMHDKTAWDQRYMTAAEYVKYVYAPMPTKEQIFRALQVNGATEREKAWTGAPLSGEV